MVNIMRINYFIALLFLFFSSCTPRVGKMITKTYSPLAQDEHITVYTNKANVPSKAETLGVVSAGDGGFTTKCDSVTIVEILKSETRKAGGNAVVITEHVKPSFWRGSCHQMTAIVLKIDDLSVSSANEDSIVNQLSDIRVFKPKRELPRFAFGADLGYGNRSANINEELNSYIQSFYKNLKHGFTWKVSAGYFSSDFLGFRLSYNSYYSSHNDYASKNDVNGTLEMSDLISSVNLSLLMRIATPKKRWMFTSSLGLGYIGLRESFSFSNDVDSYTATGSSVSSIWAADVEYKISENLGIGLNVSMLSGSLGKIKYNYYNKGIEETIHLEKKKFESLNHANALIGIRYYIK